MEELLLKGQLGKEFVEEGLTVYELMDRCLDESIKEQLDLKNVDINDEEDIKKFYGAIGALTLIASTIIELKSKYIKDKDIEQLSDLHKYISNKLKEYYNLKK